MRLRVAPDGFPNRGRVLRWDVQHAKASVVKRSKGKIAAEHRESEDDGQGMWVSERTESINCHRGLRSVGGREGKEKTMPELVYGVI